MDKSSYWVVLTQRLGYYPEGWVKHLTQPLDQNNPVAGFVHISPSTGLYLTQHFLECASRWWQVMAFMNHSLKFTDSFKKKSGPVSNRTLNPCSLLPSPQFCDVMPLWLLWWSLLQSSLQCWLSRSAHRVRIKRGPQRGHLWAHFC